MKLTAKQEMFCKEYLVDLNATQAAIRAGYSEDSAKEIGCENLTKPNIKEYIDKAMKERSQRVEITADYVLNNIKDIAEVTKNDARYGDALRAYEMLGKHLKLFTEKTELTGKDGEPVQINWALAKSKLDE